MLLVTSHGWWPLLIDLCFLWHEATFSIDSLPPPESKCKATIYVWWRIAEFRCVEFYLQFIWSSDQDGMHIQKSSRVILFIKDFIYKCIFYIMQSSFYLFQLSICQSLNDHNLHIKFLSENKAEILSHVMVKCSKTQYWAGVGGWGSSKIFLPLKLLSSHISPLWETWEYIAAILW